MTDIKLIFELQKLGYDVNEGNYEAMVKAYSMLQSNKVGLKQLSPEKTEDEVVQFPEYLGTVVQASPLANTSDPSQHKTVTIQKARLKVMLSQDAKEHPYNLTYDDMTVMKKHGITGRQQVARKSINNLMLDPQVKGLLEKIGNSLRDGTKQIRYSAEVVEGDILFEYKNQGSKSNWSIKNILNIRILPTPLLNMKLSSNPSKTVVTKMATHPQLVPFSAVLLKTDAALTNDPVLLALGWNSKMDITHRNQEDIRNRIAEIIVAQKFTHLEWVNKSTEKFGTYDYKDPVTGKTIDLKTIVTDKNNLLIKKRAKEDNSLADVLGLALVEDMGMTYRVECYGFISKESAFKYILGMPTCYIAQFDSYKIDKKILSRFSHAI